MNRLQIMVLFGGESSEHDVSIASARNVYAALDNDKYDTYLCYITKDGEWLLIDSFDDVSDPQSASELLPVLGSRAFYNRSDATTLDIDVVIPILHGRNGEDGTVQGLAQLLHIPMVGCDVTASGIAMNKLACKQVLAANELPVIPFLVHRQYENTPDFEHITSVLGDVLFVKPARAGSSVGVSKVRSKDELIAALKNAHIHDPIVLIEKAI